MVGRPGSRRSTLRFCLYRRQWRDELLRAHASRGVAELRPPNESEERTPKERLAVKTFALDERAASEPAGATEQVVSSYALAFLEECGFHRHAPIRAQPRTTTREFARRF
jgi:hypothetical protein